MPGDKYMNAGTGSSSRTDTDFMETYGLKQLSATFLAINDLSVCPLLYCCGRYCTVQCDAAGSSDAVAHILFRLPDEGRYGDIHGIDTNLICTSGTLMNRKIDLLGAQQQMHVYVKKGGT